MFARIDPLRLFDGAVIHPDDDIALWMIRRADRKGLILRPAHHERAGGIETDANHGCGIYAGARDTFPHAVANGFPNLTTRLFGYAAVFTMHRDRALGGGQKPARHIKDTGTGRAGTDIDANQVGSHLRYSLGV